uniref:Transmembrane protein 200B n=1 Tax=Gopherus evgoodei TaxID=1825980 RepID=A0A8C4W1D4_9SAUR
MTAGSAEASRAMRNQDPLEKKPLGPAPPPRRHRRRLRRKLPTEGAVKGQLRMRSPSGAFVMVGVSVVLVGMTIAVVGYWPHRGPHAAGPGARPSNSSSMGDMKKEVKGSARGRYFPHSEKLKLIGPVIMGFGLFIVICANTMLYENRDMETRLLMQKGLYSMTPGLPQDFSQEDKYCQRRTSLSLLKANADCVEGCYETPATPWRGTSICPSPPSASPGAGDDREISLAGAPDEAPRLSWTLPPSGGSIFPRGDDLQRGHVVINVQLHNPGHSKSLDLGRPGVRLVAPIKDRKNRSWPRLDHISLVGYAKLESTGESSDRLLEQTDQQGRDEPSPSAQAVGTEMGSRV